MRYSALIFVKKDLGDWSKSNRQGNGAKKLAPFLPVKFFRPIDMGIAEFQTFARHCETCGHVSHQELSINAVAVFPGKKMFRATARPSTSANRWKPKFF